MKMSSNEVDRLKQVSELASAIGQKYENLKRNELQYEMSQERSFKPILKKVDEILKTKKGEGDKEEENEENEEKETTPPGLTIDDHIYGLRTVSYTHLTLPTIYSV